MFEFLFSYVLAAKRVNYPYVRYYPHVLTKLPKAYFLTT